MYNIPCMPDFEPLLFLKTHGQQIEYGLLALIIFAAGFQTGKITSPYYASSPIIFQEADGSVTPAEEGTGDTAALEALQEQGQQLQAVDDNAEPPAQIAGATTQGQFVASVNSNLFHAADCPSAGRIKPENQVWFESIEQAQAAGYQPSKCTLEKLH